MSSPYDIPTAGAKTGSSTPRNPYDVPVASTTPPAAVPAPIATPTPIPSKQAAPVSAGFDATPWGMFVNYLQAVPEETAKTLKNVAQGVARFPLEATLTLQQAMTAVTDYTSGKTDILKATEPIPTKGLSWMLGQEPLTGYATQVEDLSNSIKQSKFAQDNGWDKLSLPLAFGTVIGGNALNFDTGGEGKAIAGEAGALFTKAVDEFTKITDPKAAYDLLIHNGIDHNIARDAAPHLANSIDRNEIEGTLKTVEALQGVVDRTGQQTNEAANDQLVHDISKAKFEYGGGFYKDNPHTARAINIYALLEDHGVTDEVANKLSDELATLTDPTEIKQKLADAGVLKGADVAGAKAQVEGMQRLPLESKQPAPETQTPKPKEEAAALPPSQLQQAHGAKNLTPEDQAIEHGAFAQIEKQGLDAHVNDYIARNKNVVNTDEAREQFPAYVADRTKSAAVHEPSSMIKNAVYDRLLDTRKGEGNNTVLATMGGTGAGKTTGLHAIGDKLDNYAIVLDSNMNKLGSAVKNIDKALADEYAVRIQFTYNDIEKSFENAMSRAEKQAGKLGSGRTLPIPEHVETHTGSHDVFPQLFDKYFDNPKVKFVLVDASGDAIRRVDNPSEMIALLDKKRYNGTYEDLVSKLEKRTRTALQEGRISAQTAHGFDPRSRGGSEFNGGNNERSEIPRGTSVGEGTQAAFEKATGSKVVNDRVPLPPSVGEILARDGRAIPIERTPAHALHDLSTGKDGKSWQSLVKGYMYNWDGNKKAHWFDKLATPEFVLEKVGLGKEAEALQEAKDRAQQTVKKEFDTISTWIDRVKNQSQDGKTHTHNDTSTLIFDWLDGREKEVSGYMTDAEIAVAREIRDYLKTWATRLGLPEENQIGKYITHIFDRSREAKGENQFLDPELASIMAENVAKSVYDPFLQKRLGAQDYVHDVWRALDAYVKRASRKEAIDPVLQRLADKAENLDQMTFNYVKDLSHKINMRPTETEQAFDSFITQTPIGHYFTDRPTAFISKKMRQVWYRGTLGLNIGSGLRNLTQGANTYAKLGERYTLTGYIKLFSRMAARDLTELYDHNVLSDSFVQDRQRSAVKKTFEAIDSTLFANYTLTETINRGAAYFGAKAQALDKGLAEEEAVKYAKRMVRETQFNFSAVDSPTWLNDDIKKTLFQLQSYNVKQLEFISRMALQKDVAGLIRFSGASFFMLYTIGRIFGMTPQQLIPTIGIGASPLTSTAFAFAGLASGNAQDQAKATNQLQRNFFSLIPAGAQIRKTVGAAVDLSKGGSYTAKGKLRYRVRKEDAAQALLFGSSALPQAQQYYNAIGKKKPISTANPYNI